MADNNPTTTNTTGNDPNIATVGQYMFGDSNNDTSSLDYGYGHKATVDKEIDCSNLVHQSLLGAGYNVPYMSTGAMQTDASGSQKNYAKIDFNDLKAGDLILFHGHVGIVTKYDPIKKAGQFYGSQSSTGPATAEFSTDPHSRGYYWGDTKHAIMGLRPTAQSYDPPKAAEQLEAIQSKREEKAFAAVTKADKNHPADDVDIQTIEHQERVLRNDKAGAPGVAETPAAPQNGAPSGTSVSSTGDPDLDRLAAALYAGDEAAISQAATQIERSPQVQAMQQQGRDALVQQQAQDQQANQQTQSLGLSR